MTIPRRLAAAFAALLCSAVHAIDDGQLQQALRARFDGDRTGACVVAAVIEGAQVARARYCARNESAPPGFETAFEIGSVSKTMAALLVAEQVRAGRWSLDDPIARHLPEGTPLPRQEDDGKERQILLRDLLTHSAGLPALPSRLRARSAADPYAALTEADLLASLADVQPAQPIGSQVAYSNFGAMLVSLALARAHGGDLEAALRQQIFAPLGMAQAHVAQPPPGTAVARGHIADGQPTPPWTILPSLAGVGMVKASLADMQRYAQAQLGLLETPRRAAMQLTQQPLAHGFGMAWALPVVTGRALVLHAGGTGGFSSLVALDPARERAVVLLSDTALADLGGLGDVGLPLLGVEVPPGTPRREQPVPPALADALAGSYRLGTLPLRIWRDGDRLLLQAAGQPVFELRHDSRGDFYPVGFSALLQPRRMGDGPVTRFVWRQGGGVVEGVRQ